jgi:hypothetical protein
MVGGKPLSHDPSLYPLAFAATWAHGERNPELSVRLPPLPFLSMDYG